MQRSVSLLAAALVFTASPFVLAQVTQDHRPLHASLPGQFDPHDPVTQPAVVPHEPWQLLQHLGSIDRSLAMLTVSIPPSAGPEERARALRAAASWNAGDVVTAVQDVHDLGQRIDPGSIELCLTWRKSERFGTSGLLSGNIRVGDLDSVTSVALAANLDGSRVYALLAHAGGSGSMDLFRSTDRGDTWTRTVTIAGSGPPPQMAVAPLSKALYVAYFPGSGSPTLRVRKFSMDTGEMAEFIDGSLTDEVFTLGAGDSVHEVASASNLVALDTRMYFAVRTHPRRVRFFWSYPLVDTLWQEIPELATSGADRGLSATYAYGTLGHRIYLSYVDTLGRVAIDTAASTGKSFRRVMTYTNAGARTSISAYRDTAVCAFDYKGSTAHVRTLMSTNGGTTWTLERPTDTTETTGSPAVMLEKGQGMALFYRHATGSSFDGRLMTRPYAATARWDSSRPITDHAPHVWRSGIVALGERTWGVIYIVNDTIPALQSVFFARYQSPSTSGVGSDERAAYTFTLHQNYPDPFNPATVIPYDLPAAAHVRLRIFDLLGRSIATLVDEMQDAGTHRVTWMPEQMATGVYLYRLEVGDRTAAKRMIFLR